ncbi:hypothetical protein MCHI_002852 [Candidatus Magnetoovum chiemensis]|nr:hypothetical protein MCHI_002852 [Candidatus Magnetoovum chiemensis]
MLYQNIKNVLIGMGDILDISSDYDFTKHTADVSSLLDMNMSDAERLYGDLNNIGQDMWKAIEKFNNGTSQRGY